MPNTEPPDITQLLQAWGAGDENARATLLSLVYPELLKVARKRFRRERPDHTLEPTALVNEVYLRLVDQTRADWKNRAQFFCVAARLMRQILVDHYRRVAAQRRPSPQLRTHLTDEIAAAGPDLIDLLDLDAALAALQRDDPRQAAVVELRFFGGLSVEETAEALGISPSGVKREWRMARAWLRRELARGAIETATAPPPR